MMILTTLFIQQDPVDTLVKNARTTDASPPTETITVGNMRWMILFHILFNLLSERCSSYLILHLFLAVKRLILRDFFFGTHLDEFSMFFLTFRNLFVHSIIYRAHIDFFNL